MIAGKYALFPHPELVDILTMKPVRIHLSINRYYLTDLEWQVVPMSRRVFINDSHFTWHSTGLMIAASFSRLGLKVKAEVEVEVEICCILQSVREMER